MYKNLYISFTLLLYINSIKIIKTDISKIIRKYFNDLIDFGKKYLVILTNKKYIKALRKFDKIDIIGLTRLTISFEIKSEKNKMSSIMTPYLHTLYR